MKAPEAKKYGMIDEVLLGTKTPWKTKNLPAFLWKERRHQSINRWIGRAHLRPLYRTSQWDNSRRINT